MFKTENSSSPKFAIRLAQTKARKYHEDTVVLETNLGDPEYTFMFPTAFCAEQFMKIANKQASLGEMEETRIRLGHEHLLDRRKSAMFARKVGRAKVRAQPEKETGITAGNLASFNQMLAY